MISNNLLRKNILRNNLFFENLVIFCLISFFFFWDIKFDLYKNISISARELFYLLFIYLLIDREKINKKQFIKIILFFFIFTVYNFLSFGINLNHLSIKHNIIALFFVFVTFSVCFFYKENIIKYLHSAFLIFIYLFALSFILSEIVYYTSGEFQRYCALLFFRIQNEIIFKEASHLGMILVPFYYYIFNVDKIGIKQKLFLIIFLCFLYIIFYSVTLLFSVLVCFFLMLILDYRFFLKNKIFSICQLLILVTPIFQSNCVFKVSHALDNFAIMNDSNQLQRISESIDLDNFTTDMDIDNINFIVNEETLNLDTKLLKIQDTIDKLKIIISEMDLRDDLNNNEKEILKNLKLEAIKVRKLQKIYIKKKLASQINLLSAIEMRNLIIKYRFDLPIDYNSKINDHSSAVLINALNVAYLSIKEKPFGWGLNNYQTAFNKYMLEKITPPFQEIYYINFNDASNNSIKLFVEFGIFSLLIFINLLYFTFNTKIPISQRILFAGIIFTQMARAAGYFNGGFLLCLLITFVLNYQTFSKNYYEKN